MSSYNYYSATLNQKRHFIVNVDCLAKKVCRENPAFNTAKSFARGTLLEEYITDRHERTNALHKSRQIIVADLELQNANNLYAVDLNRLSPVRLEEAQLLLSVKDKSERMELMKTKLDEAKSIEPGSFVKVKLPDYEGLGMVLCRGFFMEYGKGLLFGIKFMDGMQNAVRMRDELFCSQQEYRPDNCDTIVPFSALSVVKSKYAEMVAQSLGSKLQQFSSSHSSNPPSIEHIKHTINENEPVAIGERVAWLCNNGAEHGAVRWVGYIPGHSEMLAGVECDNPVGSGTGAHFDKVLFHVKSKHATFLPVCGLIREKDFGKPPSSSKKGGIFKRKKKREKEKEPFLDHKPEHTYIKNLDLDSLRLKESLNPRPEPRNATIQHPVQTDHADHAEPQQVGTSIIHNSIKTQESGPTQNEKLVEVSRTFSETDTQDKVSLHKEESLLPSLSSGYQDNLDQEGLVIGKLTLRNQSYVESQKKSATDTVHINGTHIQNDSDIAKIEYNSLSSSRMAANVESNREARTTRVPSTYPEANSKRKAKLPPSPGVQKRSASTPETDVDMTVLPLINNISRTEMLDRHATAVLDRFESPTLMKSSNLHSKSTGSKLNSTFTQNNELLKSSLARRDSFPSMDYHVPVEEMSPDNSDLEKSIGSTHSLPKNGYTSNIDSLRNEFDEHDFLFGTDVGNKDVLESLYSNDLKRRYSTDIRASFEVGSVVEVLIRGLPYYGVIQWIGYVSGYEKKVAGLEMEEEIPDSNCDGTFNTEKHFSCPPGRGFYVPLDLCQLDGRFLESLPPGARDGLSDAGFGTIDCPTITGDVAPLDCSDRLLSLFGKNKGIQGHHNSCYLDATLFSMFTFTGVFDSILHRPATCMDIKRYQEVQKVLKESIVNPLRQNLYVRADRVMKLRTLLEDLGSVSGLTSEEKDPEEFLNLLLHQILKAEPFLKLSSGQETYFYQLFVEKHEGLQVPTVQQLFDQSFLTSDIKLKEIPSCLIIQMPRFGKQFKTYNRIFPSLTLDITEVLEDSPRQCCSCGSFAEFECRECFYHFETSFTIKAFCSHCVSVVHSHKERAGHNPRKIIIPEDFICVATPLVPRVHMDLFAIVCIETSHYVAFVKCGSEPKAPWCFFDSMADRKGEQNGYNIPEVSFCPEVTEWLSEENASDVFSENDIPLSERAKRLFGDAYMCMYQSSSVMMYN